MSRETMIAVAIAMMVGWIISVFKTRAYGVPVWKSIPTALAAPIVGTIGAYLWFMVESSKFGGRSYYGAVILVPIVFIGYARLIKIPYRDLMDISAPFGSTMLVAMKYMCLDNRCCGGRVLMQLSNGGTLRFPSQIVEGCQGIILTVLLVWLSYKEKNRGKVYGWFLLLYGASRFVLNFFRDDQTPFLAWLPIGSIWSLIAVFVGALWITDRQLAIIKRPQDAKDSEAETPEEQ